MIAHIPPPPRARASPLPQKISFTGSTRVGKKLLSMSSSCPIVKKMSLELGGNAPFLVFNDADLDIAVKAAINSKFRNAGQTCVCSDRFLLEEGIEEEFLGRLVEEVEKLVVGPGLSPTTNVGPVITPSALSEVSEKVVQASSNGAEVLTGGEKLDFDGGNFYLPTVLRGVKEDDHIFCKENFGPVVASLTFSGDDEALDILARTSKAGLASYLCTSSAERMMNLPRRMKQGMVGVNEGIISSAVAPFGGVGESGLGREGSEQGMREYLETKYVFVNH